MYLHKQVRPVGPPEHNWLFRLTAIEALDDTGYRARHLSEIHVSPTLGVIVAEKPVYLSKGKDAIPSPLIRPTA